MPYFCSTTRRILIALFLASTIAVPTFASPQFPVLLVHGFRSSASTWSDFGVTLNNAGWSFGGFPEFNVNVVTGVTVGDYYLMNFSDHDTPSFPSQDLHLVRRAYEVGQVIRAILDANPDATRVIVVAHSLGGLATRGYLQNMAARVPGGSILTYNGDIASLITIGTPHAGAEIAFLCQEFDDTCEGLSVDPTKVSIQEMQPNSQAMLALNNLVAHPLPINVVYHSLVSVGYNVVATGTDGDGVVTATSQDLGQLVGTSALEHDAESLWVRSEGECNPAHPFYQQTHTCETLDHGIQAEILQRINRLPSPGSQSPIVVTIPPTNFTQGSASLNLSVNPNGASTSVWFDWGTTSSLGQETSPRRNVGAGTATIPVSITLSGLSCGRPYFFRAWADNAVGPPVAGTTLSFSTDPCGSGGGPGTIELVQDPSFEAGNNAWWVASPAFYIDDQFGNSRNGDFYAFLTRSNGTAGNNLSGGIISPEVTIPEDATDADLSFYYSVDTDETSSSAIFDKVDVYLVRSGNQLSKLATISNLDHSGTTYVRKTVDVGSSFYGEEVQIFFAGSTNSSNPTKFRIDDVSLEIDVPNGGPPDVTTESADQVTASSARLNMTADPNGVSTTVWFDFEAEDSTPNNDTEHISVGSGSQGKSVSISVFGLDCDTRYYFRANAQNARGSDQGSVRSFTTWACSGGAPNADTDPAENVTQTSATLTADVDPNGLPTQAWFAWGDSRSLGQETSRASVGSRTGSVEFSQTLTALACGTTYYFENHASNSAGEDDGATLEFTTLPCAPGGPPSQGFYLDFRGHQGCSGGAPATLLWWTAPAGMDNVFTVRRGDGGYTATVNASQSGMAHLVSNLLIPGETYSFHVEGTLNGATVKTNTVTVPILSDECRLPVGIGEVPHQPVLWAGTPFCNGGMASVRLQWAAVGGATSYTLTRSDSVAAQLTPYPDLTGTSLIDNGLLPGAAYEYSLEAIGTGGSRPTNRTSVFVPSGVCAEPSTPGAFSVQMSAPVCDNGQGAVTLSWTALAGSASSVRTYWVDEGFTHGGGSTTATSRVIDGIRPGALVKFMVQRESASTPRQYRSVILSQRIPLDICGGSASPPTVTTSAARYIQERQALLRASVVPNGRPSTAFFEWGTSASFGSTTPVRSAGDGYRNVNFGEVLANLTCGTTYHYRAVAVNANGRTNGSALSLTTAPCAPAGNTIFGSDFEHGLDGWLALEGHPMVGVWVGTVAGHASELVVEGSVGTFTARLSMDQANEPVEQLNVLSITESSMVAYRPADDAELHLSRIQSGAQHCLVGEYVEDGTSRPITLCKASGENSVQIPEGAMDGACGVGTPNAARFSQNCGAQVNIAIGAVTPVFLQDNTPTNEVTYRARVYVNLRPLQMQSGEEFDLFAAYNGFDPAPSASSGNAVVRLVVRQTSSGRQLLAIARTDSGTEVQSAPHPLTDGWRAIEINWTKATAPGANNGRFDFWIDGTAKAPLPGLDNDLLVVNYVRLGAVAGIDSGTSGAFWLDDFSSQRTEYIGPAFPFSDNPTTSSFFPFIQGIYAAEVMPGCAIGSFCPGDSITRKEMAKVILLAKFGANFTPPACTTPLFSDVPCSDPYATWINEMANRGISAGCGSGQFCPDGNVSRAQMAVFLMVAVGATPTPCPPTAFSDVPASSSFCPWIKEIATRGITSGCGGGNFCPDSLVSRGQMAVFLSTAFNLPRHLVGP